LSCFLSRCLILSRGPDSWIAAPEKSFLIVFFSGADNRSNVGKENDA